MAKAAKAKDFFEGQFRLPEVEERVLKFWRANRVFEKSVARRKGKKRFVFYEGPPTANGRPGIHHVLARAFKDVIPRYKTMAGFFAPRKGGWDTHGLPVEIEVEKQLGLKTKKDIEQYGIAAFNEKCRESVWKYKDEWEKLTERMGFWLDMKDPYITYENRYIETLWWIIKQIWEKGLMEKGHKVVPWCARCGTALSSHEMALGYKEVTDRSVYVKFKVKPGQKIGKFTTDDRTYILSWTTTPWTLPGNVALAVGKEIEYRLVEIKDGGKSENVVVAANPLVESRVFQDYPGEKINFYKETILGKNLTGLRYEPLFDVRELRNEAAYRVYPASFVTTTDGTGVVHTAVMYGEDDYQLGKKVGLPQHHTVEENGNFKKEVPVVGGMSAKAHETEDRIFDHLRKTGALFRTENYTHEYPHCWRCDTPLLYYARTSWFVTMTKLRAALQKNNKTVNWVPSHLKTGRFGGWLKEAKDWNFSRERYWGTPLPIWECAACGAAEAIGSVAELEKTQKESTNRYILVRHGQAESNIGRRVSGWPEKEKHHLTLLGRVEVEALAKALKKEKPDLIFASDLTRTKETEAILADVFEGEKTFFDARLREINTGDFNGCHDGAYHAFFASDAEKFTKRPPNGETLTELRKRLYAFLRETEQKHRGKTIVVVSHEYPLWMLQAILEGWSSEDALREKAKRGDDFIGTGEARALRLRAVPRDESGQADLHKPYIDEVLVPCKKCGDTMRRVKEVADVWFDSGSMPFAQLHYPFENKETLSTMYPADYITEGIDQTRGWFYTLLAVATTLGKPAPYKNVYVQGILLDKFGKKMSKSKGNVVDPWSMADKYGMDAVRWFIYTGTQAGESVIFDEGEIGKAVRRFHSLLYNSLAFFTTYGGGTPRGVPRSSHVLDKWIMSRLRETVAEATRRLDRYEVREAALAIEALADDLSRWYIRRSRRRFQKPASAKDYDAARATLGYVLKETALLIAPFSPFFAEALYKKLAGGESVHLADWPKAAAKRDAELMRAMEEVRRLASLGLAKRAEAGIKVRQPLRELAAKSIALKGRKEFLDILKDEVNVKEVSFAPKQKDEVALDTRITPELREEGLIRELVRTVQDLRQDAGCAPKDKIALFMQLPKELERAAQKHEALLKSEVNAREIQYKRTPHFTAETATKIDEGEAWLAVRKGLR